jgi:GGDEF domain-containing protein
MTITGWSTEADLRRVLGLDAGPVEIRPAKWVDLRFVRVPWNNATATLAIFTDVTTQIALRDAQRQLRDIGLVDPVTGLALGPVLVDHLRRSLALAVRDQRWVGVIWLQLRRFTRSTPDGQAIADEVLRQCAMRVSAAIRESDIAARLADDVLTALQAPAVAHIVAVRLLLELAPPVLAEGRERSVEAFAGIVTASDRSRAVEDLLDAARAAADRGLHTGEPTVVEHSG